MQLYSPQTSSSRRRQPKNHAVSTFCCTHGHDANVRSYSALPLQQGGHALDAPFISPKEHVSCASWLDAQMLAVTLARPGDGADPEHGFQRIHRPTLCLLSAIVHHLSTLQQTVVILPCSSAVAGRETMPIPSHCCCSIGVNFPRVIYIASLSWVWGKDLAPFLSTPRSKWYTLSCEDAGRVAVAVCVVFVYFCLYFIEKNSFGTHAVTKSSVCEA